MSNFLFYLATLDIIINIFLWYFFYYRILSASLLVLGKQFVALKNSGLANEVIEEDYKEFEQLIQREKAVVWADQIVDAEPKQNDQPTMSEIMAFPQLGSHWHTPCCK